MPLSWRIVFEMSTSAPAIATMPLSKPRAVIDSMLTFTGFSTLMARSPGPWNTTAGAQRPTRETAFVMSSGAYCPASSATVAEGGAPAMAVDSSALLCTTAHALGGGNAFAQSSTGTHPTTPSFARVVSLQASARTASQPQPPSAMANPSGHAVVPTG